MSEKYILSIDQGTTSSRAILVDKNGRIVEKSSREIQLITPKNGWIEADAVKIWISVVECINEVLIKANISFDDIDCIGVTNQRESVIAFDKFTGEPLYNCIIWQSRQSQKICNKYAKYKDIIFKKTGLVLNPYFSATKMRFILDILENKKYDLSRVYLGTVDSWLIYKLTDKKYFKTDVSNASRTLLFNIIDFKYDEELLKLFKIKEEMLPKVVDSGDFYGNATFFKTDIPITAVMGDQQAALFGHTCFNKGDFKNTYGTGCFMLLNTGKTPVFSKSGLLTSIGWKYKDNYCYVLEGSVYVGGAVVKWLRDNLKVLKSAAESETCASKISNNDRVYFVPAFVGLGTPYWCDDVRGTIFNLSQNTNYNHIVRAGLESIAYQCRDVFETMKKEANINSNTLKADGGATDNKFLMQFQSDILNMKIEIDNNFEMTSIGVAYLAGLSSGFFNNIDEIKKINIVKESYQPKMDTKKANEYYKGWKKAVQTAINYAKEK